MVHSTKCGFLPDAQRGGKLVSFSLSATTKPSAGFCLASNNPNVRIAEHPFN